MIRASPGRSAPAQPGMALVGAEFVRADRSVLNRTAGAAGPLAMAGDAYNPTVDYLRTLAAILIVLFHAGAPAGQFSVASVSVFGVLLAFYAPQSAQAEPTVETIRAKSARLLRP